MDGCSPWKISNITPRIINRNLQSLGYVPMLFPNKPGSFLLTDFNQGRRVLPERLTSKKVKSGVYYEPQLMIDSPIRDA